MATTLSTMTSVASPLLQRHNIQRARRGTPVSSPTPSRLHKPQQQSLVQTALCRAFSPSQLRKVKESLEEISSGEKQATLPPAAVPSIELIEDFHTLEPAFFPALISKVREGLRFHAPELCVEGVNGTYFLKDRGGRKIGVFKPQDEEGSSEHNPKYKKGGRAASASAQRRGSWMGVGTGGGVTSSNVRKDFKVGEASYREVAAYLLDRKHHFYGVPNTCMVKLFYPGWKSEKVGSLQEFVMNDGASWDIGPGIFPVKEVHKIGILDLHIFNTDRHGGNILLCENDDGMYSLTPIDHGYSLPTSLDRAWFDWLTWPQSRVPFDEETKRYIDSIDAEDDAKMLKTYLPIPNESILIMKISTMLLKKGVHHNLTLSQIGTIASRKVPEKPSLLEVMVEEARTTAKGVCDQALVADPVEIENTFLQTLGNVIEQHMSKIPSESSETKRLVW